MFEDCWSTEEQIEKLFGDCTCYKVIKNNGDVAVAKNLETGDLWELTEFMFVETNEEGILLDFFTDEDLLEAGWEPVGSA